MLFKNRLNLMSVFTLSLQLSRKEIALGPANPSVRTDPAASAHCSFKVARGQTLAYTLLERLFIFHSYRKRAFAAGR